ncbi:MAG: MBL fold metallo-hydrolase [Desulfobulbaceae bacterium]
MQNEPSIIRLVTGPFQVNTYLLSCRETHEGCVIDPGGETEKIIALVRERDITVRYILNTHGHADHIIGNEQLRRELGAQTAMHGDDSAFFARAENLQAERKELGMAVEAKTDLALADGDILEVGRLRIRVLHTPGHSPGSACYLVAGNLFTGDTLFVGDVGRSDLTGGSFETLLESIERKILPLPPETIVRPGHDYGEMESSTLAWEKKENPYITEFILGES